MSSISKNRMGDKNRVKTGATSASFVVTAGFNGSNPITRTRNPHDHDVLCGRGGGINSHPGNKLFREWVRERKNRYNLASNKAEKARVAEEIVDMVRSLHPPGKFLQRDPTSISVGGSSLSGWWVEIEESKAMAKTSQALREGAPKIRASHHLKNGSAAQTVEVTKKEPRIEQQVAARKLTPRTMSPASAVKALKMAAEAAKQKAEEDERRANARKRSLSQMATPLVSNTKVSAVCERPSKTPRRRKEIRTRNEKEEPCGVHSSLPQNADDIETPPLKPIPARASVRGPAAGLAMGPPASNKPWELPQKLSGINRTNSLALSDLGNVEECLSDEFVNPFEDEDDKDTKRNKSAQAVRSLTTGSSSSHGDLAGIGALFNGSQLTQKSDVRQRSTKFDGRRAVEEKMSKRSPSMVSDLSDLPDASSSAPSLVDFDEGMKTVFDVAYPGVASPAAEDVIPTHLYPYRGSMRRRSGFAIKPARPSLGWDSKQ